MSLTNYGSTVAGVAPHYFNGCMESVARCTALASFTAKK